MRVSLVSLFLVLVVSCAPATGSDPDGGASDAGTSCTPSALSCDGDAQVKCNAAGDAWAVEQQCEAGCAFGACEPCPCVADGLVCDHDTIVECSVSPCTRTVVEACEFGCVASTGAAPTCRVQECVPGVARCVAGTNRREYCRSDGMAWVIEECGSLRCTPGGANGVEAATCGPVECGCVAGSVDQCSIDGKGRTACNNTCELVTEACAGGCVLVDGVVTCRSCVPGAITCDGNTRVTCNETGSAAVRFACAGTCAEAEGGAACVD